MRVLLLTTWGKTKKKKKTFPFCICCTVLQGLLFERFLRLRCSCVSCLRRCVNIMTAAEWGAGTTGGVWALTKRSRTVVTVKRIHSDGWPLYFWPLVGEAARIPQSLFLVSLSQSWRGINALLDQLLWVREEAVVLGSLPEMILFRDDFGNSMIHCVCPFKLLSPQVFPPLAIRIAAKLVADESAHFCQCLSLANGLCTQLLSVLMLMYIFFHFHRYSISLDLLSFNVFVLFVLVLVACALMFFFFFAPCLWPDRL